MNLKGLIVVLLWISSTLAISFLALIKINLISGIFALIFFFFLSTSFIEGEDMEKTDKVFLSLFLLSLLSSIFVSWKYNSFAAFIFFIMCFIFLGILISIFGKSEKELEAQEVARKIKESGIDEIDIMSGRQFETYLAIMYRSLGYRVSKTKGSGDFGADLILRVHNKKIGVQVKRYQQNVGVRAVQEILSSMSYYDLDEGWVVTNSYFTKAAKELARKGNIKLIDRKQLISEIIQSKEIATTSKSEGDSMI